MVDLHGQYLKIKADIDTALQQVIDSCAFIGGPAVNTFTCHLSDYLGGSRVTTCANGTDALQLALMALDLHPGDEVIVPAFTYVASAEVIALLGRTPVLVDVDPNTFNVSISAVAAAITPRTRAVIPVHLFGQSCDMEPLLKIATEHHLYVVEDNAQAIGAEYKEGQTFCYIQTQWGQLLPVPAALGGKLVDLSARQGQKVLKGQALGWLER